VVIGHSRDRSIDVDVDRSGRDRHPITNQSSKFSSTKLRLLTSSSLGMDATSSFARARSKTATTTGSSDALMRSPRARGRRRMDARARSTRARDARNVRANVAIEDEDDDDGGDRARDVDGGNARDGVARVVASIVISGLCANVASAYDSTVRASASAIEVNDGGCMGGDEGKGTRESEGGRDEGANGGDVTIARARRRDGIRGD